MSVKHAPAQALTKMNEGFYDNDPLDPGGETIWGIARNRPPSNTRAQHLWSLIWARVDNRRGDEGFPLCLREDTQILGWSDEIYLIEWWNPLKPDYYPEDAQPIANRVYDVTVNMGPTWGTRFMQQALNRLGNNGEHWRELDESGEHGADGLMGPVSSEALHACFEKFGTGIANVVLGDAMKLQQIARREYLVGRNRDLNRYLRGWIARDLRDTGAVEATV